MNPDCGPVFLSPDYFKARQQQNHWEIKGIFLTVPIGDIYKTTGSINTISSLAQYAWDSNSLLNKFPLLEQRNTSSISLGLLCHGEHVHNTTSHYITTY